MSVTRIAHLSDLHLLEEDVRRRRGVARLQVEYLSLKRPLNPDGRRARAELALADAAAADPDHLVITGDLTEDGVVGQYDVLRQLLDGCGLEPGRVTLLPGNHDGHGLAWAEALAGPLDRWAATSRPGEGVRLSGVRILPVSTAVEQAFWKSSGRAPDDQLAEVVRTATAAHELVILAQHHPPFRVRMHWIHGLQNVSDVAQLLAANPNVSLLYGHMHVARDVEVAPGEGARAFAPCAVVDGDDPLRIYAVDGNRLVPLERGAAAA
ncbi:metallophosphatase [Deltaproteobacteria bacterium]|nr:metallophosphatase [Deltaproteobacteria bacterium]